MRLEEPFILEALERSVDSADRILATDALDELAAHFETVGVLPESRHGDERSELEPTGERWLTGSGHKYYVVEQIENAQEGLSVSIPTIISPKASNWVDRGEPPHATIQRVLARFLERNPATDPAWFRQQSDTIVGMVAADATEVHVAGFLRSLVTDASAEPESTATRTVAIAVWHIAKAALVRDFAERVLRGDVPPNQQTPDSLSHWLAARLLTPDQLSAFEERDKEGSLRQRWDLVEPRDG